MHYSVDTRLLLNSKFVILRARNLMYKCIYVLKPNEQFDHKNLNFFKKTILTVYFCRITSVVFENKIHNFSRFFK